MAWIKAHGQRIRRSAFASLHYLLAASDSAFSPFTWLSAVGRDQATEESDCAAGGSDLTAFGRIWIPKVWSRYHLVNCRLGKGQEKVAFDLKLLFYGAEH